MLERYVHVLKRRSVMSHAQKAKGQQHQIDSPSDSGTPCDLVLCEDPKTGELIVRPRGNCPKGYIEKFRDRAQEEGITFIIPRVRSREEDQE